MRTIKLTIEYDGTNYCGWQIQKNGVAVQQVIQDAVSKITSEGVKLHGASRTDAGVHALGQVAHFHTKSSVPCDGFQRALNSILPMDIRIADAAEADAEFHSQKDAKGKHYRYLISNGSNAPALYNNRVWHVPFDLNLDVMKDVSSLFIGRHDFKSFQAAGCSAKHAIRTIHEFTVSRINRASCKLIPSIESGFCIDVVGDGFVRHMIRNMIGTLIEAGQGRLSSEDVKEIIKSCKRSKAGVCAPACGLYLVEVFY